MKSSKFERINQKIHSLLQRLQGQKVGVFVDDSNLYHAYKKAGWRVDFKKFREVLSAYCDLQFINYYIAIPHISDTVAHGTEIFLNKINRFVTIKRKELKYTPVAGKFVKKADVDVEIVLDVVRAIDSLDCVIVMSGDSDYRELKNYVVGDKGKEIIFWSFEKNMAWELKYCWHLYLDDYKEEFGLELYPYKR